jgi:hypothetical protein
MEQSVKEPEYLRSADRRLNARAMAPLGNTEMHLRYVQKVISYLAENSLPHKE